MAGRIIRQFNGYVAKDHERIFLSPFQKSEGLNLLFQNLVKVAYQNAGSPRKMFGALREQELIRMGRLRRTANQRIANGDLDFVPLVDGQVIVPTCERLMQGLESRSCRPLPRMA